MVSDSLLEVEMPAVDKGEPYTLEEEGRRVQWGREWPPDRGD